MNKDLVAIFDYMERERGIKRDLVVAAIEESLQAAARKSLAGAENVSVQINSKSGEIEVFCEKKIVDEVYNPVQQISIEEARELDEQCEVGQFIDIEVTPKNFGRIAAQTARQIIGQKLRSAERDVIYEEYRHRIGEIVSGTVKRFARGANLVVDLGKVEALMPARHYPKIETYQIGDRVQALLLMVQDLDNGGAEVILSRSDPGFVQQLFEQEVPEIADGTVQIERIVRDAGYRTKIAVRSSDARVDPVGTCVGVRGTRVKAIVRELNNEKVDVIPYSDDPITLLENALEPIELLRYSVDEDNGVISMVVPDDNYGAVLGKRGMNARLNGQLTGYELKIKKDSDYKQLALIERREAAESEDPALDEPLKLDGLSSLLVQNLVEGGYDTPRKVLQTAIVDLAEVPGMSIDLADRVQEQLTRAYNDRKRPELEPEPEEMVSENTE